MPDAIVPNSDILEAEDKNESKPDWIAGLRSNVAGLDLKIALFFLGLYYIRPQDWVPGMAGFNIIRPLMIVWFFVILSQGSRSVVRGWFKTPHDWAILFYAVYTVWIAPSESGTLSAMFSLSVFYYLTCHALSTWDAILSYLKVWNFCILSLAVFGVLQIWGLDITEGRYLTEFFQGRLSLGTYLTNNPNALGHTIVLSIPLSYVMFFWKGSVFGRLILFPMSMLVVGWCAWETQSKGSFVVGAGLTVLLFVVGRPRWIKILVIATALTLGVGALSFLPRMEQMGDLRSDEGVQGRLMAWTLAKGAMDTNTFGVGWRKFIAIYPWRWGNKIITVYKATHSSYIQIGADLGMYGLGLWLLAIWTAIRTAAFFKAENDQQERCRRALMLLLAGYLASSWMINRQYYTEYFLIIAVAAAIHRLSLASQSEPASATHHTVDSGPSVGAWNNQETFQRTAQRLNPSWVPADPEVSESDLDNPLRLSKLWNRIGAVDVAVAATLTWLVIYIWEYILTNL